MVSPLKKLAMPKYDFWLQLAATATLTALVALATAFGLFRPLEHGLEAGTFAALDRAASGQIHVVEMDAESMAAVRRWPWPRDHYARVVQQLAAAGARSITFDVDFSSASEPHLDNAFGAAIAAAQTPVALATFGQDAGFGEGRQLDSLPVSPLRKEAHLVSVSVVPDHDGFVRRMPLGTITEGIARPSLAAFVAGKDGSVGQSFPIDFAINPATIPRHSFIAVERGEFPAGSLEGKDVIIGATAIELGDRYPVPRHGIVPGVLVQAVAAETLRAGVPSYGGWAAPLAFAFMLSMLVISATQRGMVASQIGAGMGIVIIAVVYARVMNGTWFNPVPAIALLASIGALQSLILTHRRIQIERQTDTASGLPNRLGLNARKGQAEDRYLVAAQVDDFAALSLTVGSENIGELLSRIAQRLKTAGALGPLYRLDDRVLAWVTPLEIAELEQALTGLKAVMRSPFEIAGKRLGISLTFGVACADAVDAATNAIHAANLAKQSGKNWRLHLEGAEEAASDQLSVLGELDEALATGEISVLYQPKLNLKSQRIDAAEALVRWHHPTRGVLPPDWFIPILEDHDRIEDLTYVVINQTLEDMRRWCEQGLVLGVAINISATLLSSESFASHALGIISRSGVPPQRITFEVTETAQFDDSDTAIAILERFRAAGIRISMDDYGTGLSGLNYLRQLPLCELKIDRMFVQHAHRDHSDAMLVHSTLQLAHNLDLQVVAEGVEESECLAFLEEIGCDYAQGYFIDRPLSADEMINRASQIDELAA